MTTEPMWLAMKAAILQDFRRDSVRDGDIEQLADYLEQQRLDARLEREMGPKFGPYRREMDIARTRLRNHQNKVSQIRWQLKELMPHHTPGRFVRAR